MKIFSYCWMLTLISLGFCQPLILKTIQLTNTNTVKMFNSPVGFSFPWSIRNYVNNTVLQAVMTNGIPSNAWTTAFTATFRPSADSDYGCVATDTYCTNNITYSDLTNLGSFIFQNFEQPSLIAGIRFTSINLTRWKNFFTDLKTLSSGNFIVGLGEYVDTYVSRGFRSAGYDINSYLIEMNNVIVNLTGTSNTTFTIAGPGVSSNASSWIKNMSIFFNACPPNPIECFFTINLNFFEN
jgi:hypothetical protein